MNSGQKRRARLRRHLLNAREARVKNIETYLRACGWRQRATTSGHRAWVTEGKRTLVIPIHGGKVREYVIQQILEATGDGNDEDQGGDGFEGRRPEDKGQGPQ